MAEAALLRVLVEHDFSSGFVLDVRLELELRPGSVLVLFGPSGAGKTTILRGIAGLERLDVAWVSLGDEVWCNSVRNLWRPPQDRRIGLVFQEPTLFPHLTVR